MARIAGVNIPDNKIVRISLTYIMGIGQSASRKILKQANIDSEKRVKDLSTGDLRLIQGVIDKNNKVEGELRREVLQNIKRLKDINSYRGMRHRAGLPCRGQRTRYNARTTRALSGKKQKLAVGGTSMKKIKASASEKT